MKGAAGLLEGSIGREGVRCLFLSGSFALGEESIALDAERPVLLSDVDISVVVDSLDRLRELFPGRGELGAACQELLPEVVFSGRVNIGLFLECDLRTLPPNPGVYDMRRRGRVLSGDPALLESIPDYSGPDVSSYAAAVLLENRIAGLLGAHLMISRLKGEGLYTFLYEIARAYTDMATAALCLAGLYIPGYSERCRLISEKIEEEPGGLLSELLSGSLPGEVERWTMFKIEPSAAIKSLDVECDRPAALWRNASVHTMRLWVAARARLAGQASRPDDEPRLEELLGMGPIAGGWRNRLRSWRSFLSSMPPLRRLAVASALGGRLLRSSPAEIVREHCVRLLNHKLRAGPGEAVTRPKGAFPHGGGDWESAASELFSMWREMVFGR